MTSKEAPSARSSMRCYSRPTECSKSFTAMLACVLALSWLVDEGNNKIKILVCQCYVLKITDRFKVPLLTFLVERIAHKCSSERRLSFPQSECLDLAHLSLAGLFPSFILHLLSPQCC